MNENAKHTPGPWSVGFERRTSNHEQAFRICGGADAGGFPRTVAKALTQADADLIASAPDLLADRDRLLAVNAELVKAGERCLAALAANGAPNCEAAKEMRAALSRAKGE